MQKLDEIQIQYAAIIRHEFVRKFGDLTKIDVVWNEDEEIIVTIARQGGADQRYVTVIGNDSEEVAFRRDGKGRVVLAFEFMPNVIDVSSL